MFVRKILSDVCLGHGIDGENFVRGGNDCSSIVDGSLGVASRVRSQLAKAT